MDQCRIQTLRWGRGGVVIQTLTDKGGRSPPKKFCALQALVWSKNKGGAESSGPLPWICHCELSAKQSDRCREVAFSGGWTVWQIMALKCKLLFVSCRRRTINLWQYQSAQLWRVLNSRYLYCLILLLQLQNCTSLPFRLPGACNESNRVGHVANDTSQWNFTT